MSVKTKSGEFTVYHGKRESGNPDLHKDGWYFEPTECGSGEVYSNCYPTQQAALEAAEAWEERESAARS